LPELRKQSGQPRVAEPVQDRQRGQPRLPGLVRPVQAGQSLTQVDQHVGLILVIDLGVVQGGQRPPVMCHRLVQAP
jgi:hypothetical protein